MAENAKWITHDNRSYMIAVMYAEQTGSNPFDPNFDPNDTNKGGGRVLNFTQMYNNFNNPDRNRPSYFGAYHNNIERPPAIQSGTTHILWKIFNKLTSGW